MIGIACAATLADTARADDVDACVTASERGQELRDQGKLIDARALFVECAAARCPAIVQKDCAAWLAGVEDKLPSIAVHARDSAGKDLSDVRVAIDGKPAIDRLDGLSLSVDPGTHTFRFERDGSPAVEQTLLLHEGEKNRPVEVILARPASIPPARALRVPAAAWALGAVSLASFGAMTAFGVSATTAVEDMRAPGGCAPHCDPARVDAARRDMILTNVLLGVGAATLGTAAILVVVELATGQEQSGNTPLRARVGVGPGSATLSGSW
ncbi:MAG: hypothetical protein R3F14_42530 [Polyangiaceae bacterium]